MVEEGQALPETRKTLTQDQVNRYAQVSGDGNLIHLDPEFAARGPFGRIVAHGMLVLGFLSEMMTQAFGRHWLESGRLKVRFRAPVYPGEDVIASGKVTSLTTEGGSRLVRCQVACRKADGQDVITGEAWVVMPGP